MIQPQRWPGRVSNAILAIERPALIALTALLLILILLNIVTRTAGAALFWVDELAVYTLIWMVMIGASVMVRQRSAIAVTLVTDWLPDMQRRLLLRVVDLLVFGIAIALLALCWIWYQPDALIRSRFDFALFSADTFNFIYSAPTNTVGIQKYWVWLAVPLMAVTMAVHALANLIEGPPESGAARELSL